VLILKGAPFEQVANQILAQSPAGLAGNGELGIPIIPIAIGAGTLLLGGGTLWTFHEKHTEKDRYFECLEEMTNPPFDMDPAEAGMVCSGQVQKGGFKLGLNTPTLILAASSVAALWLTVRMLRGKI